MLHYTREEVSARNGKNGTRTWIIIHDMVYDVTDYLNKHPGGPELIEEHAGNDATSGFDDFGHSSDAKRTLKDFLIGELVEEDKTANRKKKGAMANGTKSGNVENKRRRTFLALLCGKCTS